MANRKEELTGLQRIKGVGLSAGAPSPASETPITPKLNRNGDLSIPGDYRWKSGTGFFGAIVHAISAARTWTFPNVSGHVPALPTAATTETGSDEVVRKTSPTIVTPTVASLTNMQHNHQNAAGGGALAMAAISDLPVLASGTWTPTLTNVANLDASTAHLCQYLRIGSIVHCSGQFDADATTAAVDTLLSISLPISSAFVASGNLAGVAFNNANAGLGAAIYASGGIARVQWLPPVNTNQPYLFTFTYRII